MGDTLSSESSKKSPIRVPDYSLAQLFQNVKRNLHLGSRVVVKWSVSHFLIKWRFLEQ